MVLLSNYSGVYCVLDAKDKNMLWLGCVVITGHVTINKCCTSSCRILIATFSQPSPAATYMVMHVESYAHTTRDHINEQHSHTTQWVITGSSLLLACLCHATDSSGTCATWRPTTGGTVALGGLWAGLVFLIYQLRPLCRGSC